MNLGATEDQTAPPLDRRKWLAWALGLAALIVGADQASKAWVLYGLDLETVGSIPIWPFLSFTMVWNRGISYGLFAQEGPLGQALISSVMGAIIIVMLVWLWRQPSRLMAIITGLVVGGAIGNLYDRLVYGAVVDFVHLHLGPYNWYVFNVADTSIVIAGGLMVADILFASPEGGRKA
jgi:signal peptidase II